MATSRKQTSSSSARAEQQKESRDAVILPQAAMVGTKESARGMLAALIGCGLVGALIALPFAFIEFGDIPLGGRLVIAVLIGLVAGGSVGGVIGQWIAQRRKISDDANSPPGTSGRPGLSEVAEARAESEGDARRQMKR